MPFAGRIHFFSAKTGFPVSFCHKWKNITRKHVIKGVYQRLGVTLNAGRPPFWHFFIFVFAVHAETNDFNQHPFAGRNTEQTILFKVCHSLSLESSQTQRNQNQSEIVQQ